MDGWVYETGSMDQPAIFLLGWDDWAPYPVDPKVAATTIRHGNFDYVTNSVKWDPNIAPRAAELALPEREAGLLRRGPRLHLAVGRSHRARRSSTRSRRRRGSTTELRSSSPESRKSTGLGQRAGFSCPRSILEPNSSLRTPVHDSIAASIETSPRAAGVGIHGHDRPGRRGRHLLADGLDPHRERVRPRLPGSRAESGDPVATSSWLKDRRIFLLFPDEQLRRLIGALVRAADLLASMAIGTRCHPIWTWLL
jgi:hypothetical protein